MERSGSLLIGGIGIGTGYFIYSMATNIVMFYIGALFVGVFPAFCSSTTTGEIVNRWFGNLNTTLLSISVAKGGFGGTLGSIIVGRWLGSIGYVSSFRYMAILIVVVMVVVSLLVRNSPQDKNTTMLWVSGQDKVAHSQEDRAGYTIKQAVKTYNFWAMAAFFGLYTIAFYAAYANVSLHMADLGWSPELYGTIFSFVNTANVIAIFVGGYATDKLGPRINLHPLRTLRRHLHGARIYDAECRLDICGLLPHWRLLALCFGSRDSVTIIAILTAAVTAGASVGIPAANVVYDLTGSYSSLFTALLVVLCLMNVHVMIAYVMAAFVTTILAGLPITDSLTTFSSRASAR